MSQATLAEDSRPSDGTPRKDRWWWTLAGREAVCESCEAKLQPGQKIAYHYIPSQVYCPACARKMGVSGLCKPSRRLEISERALERHSAKVQELKEALERRNAKVLELRKALLQSQDRGEEVAALVDAPEDVAGLEDKG